MTPLTRRLGTVSVIVVLVAGIPAFAPAQSERQGGAQESGLEKVDTDGESHASTAEDVALGTASVLVSAVQVPLRGATCGGTVVVAGLAYLLTAFDREARQGPADAIKRVCGGSYVTTPSDLRRD